MRTVTCIGRWLLLSMGLLPLAVGAQQPALRYVKATALVIGGQLLPTAPGFHRLDTAAYPDVPPVVRKLLTHAAGEFVCFTTNSRRIAAKWCVSASKPYANMTAIANKGLDLYIRKNGKWQYAGVGKPDSVCNEGVLADHMDEDEKECLLYLPLYDEVHEVEIGVEPQATIRPGALPFGRRVLVYGSSIVQGASASRPGMAYPARLSRLTGWDFLNLGLSGSAKMEPAVIKMVNDIPADAYLLDCIPNSSAQNIRERTLPMIRSIQAAHPGKPVILLNSISREQGFVDQQVGAMVRTQNRIVDSITHQLLTEGAKDFYYIDVSGFLGDDHEGSTDGVHPNDLGSFRFVEKLQPLVLAILKKYF